MKQFVVALCGVFLASALMAQSATPQPDAAPTPTAMPRPATPVPATPPPPSVVGSAWLLMDHATGQILAGENVDAQIDPASITKIMTSYVVSAEIAAGKLSRDDQVRISENAWRGGGAGTDGSTSFLPLDSDQLLDDLLHGVIIQSGNDASIALAEHVAGSEAAFADLMNQYAARLGMRGTRYVNSHGLPAEGHYTTARDVATLSQALIRDFPEDYAYYRLKEHTINGIKQHNRNSLLWRDASVDGIKTGHTSAAGWCLAASAEREGMRLISVVMGSTSEKQRADDNQALLNWGFRFFESHTPYAARSALSELRVWKSPLLQMPVGLAEALTVLVPRGRYAQLKAELELPKRLIAPIAKDAPLGTLRISLDDELLVERPLLALEEAPEAGFFGRQVDALMLWWDGE
jgi:D-alanyl-D-alanine carboxypeptidase (penicillin-binding protein 5/6)